MGDLKKLIELNKIGKDSLLELLISLIMAEYFMRREIEVAEHAAISEEEKKEITEVMNDHIKIIVDHREGIELYLDNIQEEDERL